MTAPRRHLAFGTALAAAAQIAPLAASAGVSLTVARLYGPAGTGSISLVLNLFNVVLMISTFGLSSGVSYLISRREWPLRQAVRETSAAALSLGAVGAIAGLSFYLATRHTVLKGIRPSLAIVSLATLPFAISWAFSAAAALGRDSYEAYASFEFGNSFILLVAGIPLAIAFGLIGVVAAFAAANVLTAALGWVWARRELRRDVDRRATSGALARAARFGIQAWMANLLQLINYRFDIFIVAAVASRGSVGVYSIAVSVTALGWVLPDALQTVLFPRVASLDAEAVSGGLTAEASDAAAARAVRHAVMIVVPTAVFLAVLVLAVPLVFGARFERSVALGFILIPGVLALGPGKVVAAILTGRGFPRYAVYVTAITTPITIGLYLALIPGLHAKGAALASTLSYLTSALLSLVFLRRATSISLRAALIPSRADLGDYAQALALARAHLASRFRGDGR